MDQLEILLMGPPFVQCGGRILEIKRRIPRLILYFLAEQNRLVTRGELMRLFWPERSDTAARQGLRENLSKLRASLPGDEYLQTFSTGIRLNPTTSRVDLLEFRQICERVNRESSADGTMSPILYAEARECLHFWRSLTLLDGTDLPNSSDLEEWLRVASQNSEHYLLRLLEHLERSALAENDTSHQVEFLEIQAELDPFNEDIHYRLITALARGGRMKQALDHGDHVVDAFSRELQENPSSQLLNLISSLRQQQSSETRQPGAELVLQNTTAHIFKGRLETIHQVVEHVLRGGIAVISGETGIGKSRLLDEVQARVSQQQPGLRLLRVQAFEHQSRQPFHLIIDLLRVAVTTRDWLEIPDEYRRSLIAMIPELDMAAPIPASEAQVPGNLSKAFVFVLRHIMVNPRFQYPVVIIVDDMQYADIESCEVLQEAIALGFFAHRRGLLLTTDSILNTTACSNLIQVIRNNSLYSHFPLEKITIQDMEEYLLAADVSIPSPGDRNRLLEYTGGNPLFLLETLPLFLTGGEPGSILSSEPVPLSVHSLVQGHLRKLPDIERAVLFTAAVIGGIFDLRVLEASVGVSAESVVQALEHLEQIHLIEPVIQPNPGGVIYRFVHQVTRGSILKEISPARKRLIHRRVAAALEMTSPSLPSNAFMLAEHYEYAGEYKRAFTEFLTAASHAKKINAVQEESRAFFQAERVLKIANIDFPNSDILNLHKTFAEHCYRTNHLPQLERLGVSLRRYGEARHDPTLVGCSLNILSDWCFASGSFSDGIAYSEQAILYLDHGTKPLELAHSYATRCSHQYMLNQLLESYHSIETAYQLISSGEIQTNSLEHSNILYQLSITKTLLGYPTEGIERGRQALDSAVVTGNAQGRLNASQALALAHYYAGDLHAARQVVQSGLALAGQIQHWRMQGYLWMIGSFVELHLGAPDKALDYAQNALRVGNQSNYQEMISAAYRSMGDVYRYLTDYKKAAEKYQLGIDQGGLNFVTIDNRARLGFVIGQLGYADLALTILKQALKEAEAIQLGAVSLAARFYWLSLIQGQAENSSILSDLSSIRSQCLERGLINQYVAVLTLSAHLHHAAGHNRESVILLQEVLEHTRRSGDIWSESSALVFCLRHQLDIGLDPMTIRKILTAHLDQIRNNSHRQDLMDSVRLFQSRMDSPQT